MEIPIFIVDDESVDRMIAHKRIKRSSQSDLFKPITEYEAGDIFLQDFVKGLHRSNATKPLVLMDVNMPRMNGFETINEMLRAAGGKDDSVVVMMFTSSSNPLDMKRASESPLVKGFITKPIDEADIAQIVSIYECEKRQDAPDQGAR